MPYIERDTSWMYFNKRILLEAMRPDLPLLERFNYLGIYSNNLDEFFRVRVASLRRLIDSAEELPSAERDVACPVAGDRHVVGDRAQESEGDPPHHPPTQ